MTTPPDTMEQRLNDAEKAINAFEAKVEDPYYQHNPTRAVKDFASDTIAILRKQHQILVLLEHRIAKGPE